MKDGRHRLLIGTSGEVTRISGEVVSLPSSQRVRVSGDVLEIVDGGGSITIDGTVTGRVSGETISLPSTQAVRVSGETVTIVDGGGAITVDGSVTGKVSGETVSLPSSQQVKVSGEEVQVVAQTQDGTQQVLGAHIGVTPGGAGVYDLASSPGLMTASLMMGAYTQTSGQVRNIEQTGGRMKVKDDFPGTIDMVDMAQLSSASGGVCMVSGRSFLSVAVRNPTSQSADVYLGGDSEAGGNMPYSGFGFLLEPGEGIALDAENGEVYGFSAVSGSYVTWITT